MMQDMIDNIKRGMRESSSLADSGGDGRYETPVEQMSDHELDIAFNKMEAEHDNDILWK